MLIHGMGRTPLSMLPLQITLQRAGYRVLNFGYSSFGPSVAAIGASLAAALERQAPAPRVHFVGHSLGNIVIRWLLAYAPPARVGRVVMLAPPNQGARIADRLAPAWGWLLAPLRELTTGDSTAVRLPAPQTECAIIAGRHDGKVSIAETQLANVTTHRVIESGHTIIMMRPSVLRLVRQFIAEGRC